MATVRAEAPLYWLNDEDSTLDVLAAVAVRGREKRAKLRVINRLTKQATEPSFWNDSVVPSFNKYVGEPIQNAVINPLTKSIGESAGKHVGYGLIGAGLGAGAGMLGQMFAPKKKRRPLSAALTGGLLGAGLGAGGSLLYSNVPAFRNLFSSDQPKVDPKQRAAELDAAAQAVGRSQAHNPAFDEVAKQYMVTPETMRDLALSAQGVGNTAAYSSFLDRAAKNPDNSYGRFSLPSKHPYAQGFEPIEAPIDGLSPVELRGLRGNTPDIQKMRNAFMQKVLSSYKTKNPIMRPLPTTENPNNVVPWTQADLEAELPKYIDKAHGDSRTYRWDLLNRKDEAQKQHAYRLLDEWVNQAKNNKMVDYDGTSFNPINSFPILGRNWRGARTDMLSRGTQIKELLAKDKLKALGLASRTLGIGNVIPGNSPPNEGLPKELARRFRSNVELTDADLSPTGKFGDVLKAGLNPVELLDVDRGGVPAQEQYIQRVLREKRLKAPNTPWTEEELRKELPTRIRQTRALAGTDTTLSKALDTSITGDQNTDLAALAIGADTAATLGMQLRNRIRGYNPNDLYVAVKDSLKTGKIGNLSEQQVKYLQHVYENFGMKGLKQLANDPMKFQGTGNATGSWNPFSRNFGQGGKPLFDPGTHLTHSEVLPAAHKAVADLANANQPQLSLTALENSLNARLNAGTPGDPRLAGNITGDQARELLAEIKRIKDLKDPVEQQNSLNELGRAGLSRPAQAAKYDVAAFGKNLIDHLKKNNNSEYAKYLEANPAEVQALFNSLETSKGKVLLPYTSNAQAGVARPPAMDAAALRNMRGQPSSNAVPDASVDPGTINTLGARQPTLPGSGLPTDPAQVKNLGDALNKAISTTEQVAGLDAGVAKILKAMPEAERSAIIQKLLSDPKAKVSLGGVTITGTDLAAAAAQGESKGLWGYLKRPVGGGILGRAPYLRHMGRLGGLGALGLAAEMYINAQRPSPDRLESILSRTPPKK